MRELHRCAQADPYEMQTDQGTAVTEENLHEDDPG